MLSDGKTFLPIKIFPALLLIMNMGYILLMRMPLHQQNNIQKYLFRNSVVFVTK